MRGGPGCSPQHMWPHTRTYMHDMAFVPSFLEFPDSAEE